MSATLHPPEAGVRLDELGTLVGGRVVPGEAGARWVTGVRHDSRTVEPGDLFAAIPGARIDGARFADDALARGAAGFLAERPLRAESGAPTLVVPDVRRALGPVAEAVYGNPTTYLRAVGVTGTNGKTTTTWLIDGALRRLGARPALVGTVLSRGPDGEPTAAGLTTPEADDLARFARRAVDAQGSHLVFEASSIGLALHRPDGVRFAVAAFTNLSRDHLDFHGSLDAYVTAKGRLFRDLAPSWAVINVDDPVGADLARSLPEGSRVLRVAPTGTGTTAAEAELLLTAPRADRDGVAAEVRLRGAARAGAGGRDTLAVASPLVGLHNLENLAVALGCLLALGVEPRAAAAALAEVPPAPGRLERVRTAEGSDEVAVFVDYAHTPAALGRTLDALRPLTPGRLVVVFGCGGDRDAGKRALMGEAAVRRADLSVLTSDNPRTEDPDAILAAIEEGARGAGGRLLAGGIEDPPAAHGPWPPGAFVRIRDRRLAIAQAVAAAASGDVVLLAGKGHEPYQLVGTERRPFDDREEAAIALRRRPPPGEAGHPETARSERDGHGEEADR
jgi:UDP-N-acetylmuramoyl-L-alanyl-D-glutamate--2,6-diaminopimelate ligase